jgi:hypothetical protein
MNNNLTPAILAAFAAGIILGIIWMVAKARDRKYGKDRRMQQRRKDFALRREYDEAQRISRENTNNRRFSRAAFLAANKKGEPS